MVLRPQCILTKPEIDLQPLPPVLPRCLAITHYRKSGVSRYPLVYLSFASDLDSPGYSPGEIDERVHGLSSQGITFSPVSRYT